MLKIWEGGSGDDAKPTLELSYIIICLVCCIHVCISERPPVLFEARSRSDLGISFGGVPSVYLHNGAPTNKSVFHVRSLHSKQLVQNTYNTVHTRHCSCV